MSSSPGGDALAVRILFAFHMYMALRKEKRGGDREPPPRVELITSGLVGVSLRVGRGRHPVRDAGVRRDRRLVPLHG
jgi:hypothetical protein